MSVTLIKTNGENVNLGDEIELERVQEFVGGYVELLTVLFAGETAQLLVNEDGTDLPINSRATMVYRETHRGGLIVGPAVLLTGVSCWEE